MIRNKTDVLILQHSRERLHAFNTARIVDLALRSSRLLKGYNHEFDARHLPLDARAGLLFPDPQAPLLSELTDEQKPKQLVVLDGTWHHAKTMVRDISQLRHIKRFRLAPSHPGCFRIRKEPNEFSLSTLEATVLALQSLEPETKNLEELFAAFEYMVELQLRHPDQKQNWRHNQKRTTGRFNIPKAIVDDLANIVVLYAEAAPGGPGKADERKPVYLVAQRLVTNESFSCFIDHSQELNAEFLVHLNLSRSDFDHAQRVDLFQAQWRQFVRPTDVLVSYHKGPIRMLEMLEPIENKTLFLKSIRFREDRHYQFFEDLLAGENIVPGPAIYCGRAGQRLANAVAFVTFLHKIGLAHRRRTI